MKVGVLGLGLIGGSMARAFAKAGNTVYACDTDADMLGFAQVAGIVSGELNADAIEHCDLIILAIHASASAEWLQKSAPLISSETLVVDCCGLKREICKTGFALAEKYRFTFCGGHPMAGSHKSGFKYSRSNLFQGAPMVLVPPRRDDPELLERVMQAFAPCGFGSFSITSAENHDQIIAFTSQMPHVISNAYMKSPTAKRHKGFSAGSYKDLTRVAWLNTGMWTELFLSNRDNLLKELNGYIESLCAYRDAIENRDAETLTKLLDQGRKLKKEIDG